MNTTDVNSVNTPISGNKYFASDDANKTAAILLGKSQTFFNVLRSNAYLEKINAMWRYYHGAFMDDYQSGHQINLSGEQGELLHLPINHFRNIAQHMLVMITANRPVMEARAVNTDYKSLAQTYLANGILDYYMREKGLEDALRKATEYSIVMGAGFIKMDWNATAGEPYDFDEEEGKFNYEGEIEFSVLSPFDVVVDGTKETWNHDWMMVRSFQNRYNLMAKYPELAEKIQGLPSKADNQVTRLGVWSNDDTDDVAVYEFYHKRTEALPDGRYLLFVDSDIVLLDAKLPYRVIPVFRISPADILGTPYGYTPMFDIFPIQEGINALYSSVMTNQNAFAVQNLFVKRGSDLAVSSLEGGMNIVEGNEKPEAIQLTATAPEVFKFIEMLISAAETVSGINSVTRGSPDASLHSGNALALVQSMALQFMSGLQQSYVKLIEDTGTALIQILKDYATTPKVVALVGKNNRPLLKEFVNDDISAINRVVVDVGNPLSRTIAGRVQMAEQLLQMHLIKDSAQYFQVLNTGRLDTMFEGETNELLLIKSENEKMLEGIVPIVSPLDRHTMHIQEHKSVLSDADIRENPGLVKDVMDHIQMHMQALESVDPRLLSIIGETPLPPLQPPGMPPGAPPGGPQGGPPQGQPPHPPGPGGPPGPNAPQQPNQATLQHSPMAGMMSPVAGQVVPGQTINGPGVHNVHSPNIPHPPKPFQNLPTQANQMIPGR